MRESQTMYRDIKLISACFHVCTREKRKGKTSPLQMQASLSVLLENLSTNILKYNEHTFERKNVPKQLGASEKAR